MAEMLVEFSDSIADSDGITYARAPAVRNPIMDTGRVDRVRADGRRRRNPFGARNDAAKPDRHSLLGYGADAGRFCRRALQRALKPLTLRGPRSLGTPAYSEPAPDINRDPPHESILNPFSVYRKGEGLLRQQLHAFSAWHLVNIIRAHDLASASLDELNEMSPAELIEMIVTGVRSRTGELIS